MKQITREMLRIYKPLSDMDWLNYKLVKSQATYHHIKKKEHGGKETIENGAILMPQAHQYLHTIELREVEIYIALNKMFELINKQKHEPTPEQREVIEFLLEQFEELHKNDKNAKGKKLIKYQYTQRQFKKENK